MERTYRMRGCDGLDFATVTHAALRKGNVVTRMRGEGDERERAHVPIQPRVHFPYPPPHPRALVHRNTNYLHCEIMARDGT